MERPGASYFLSCRDGCVFCHEGNVLRCLRGSRHHREPVGRRDERGWPAAPIAARFIVVLIGSCPTRTVPDWAKLVRVSDEG